MSKWSAKYDYINDDDTGEQIAETYGGAADNALARQIVREHNAHAELVSCLSAMLKITCGECQGEKPGNCSADPLACALSAQARAAIEAAEGRE